MARKINVSLTPMNVIKGSKVSFPYLIDKVEEKFDPDFVEGVFEGTTDHRIYPIELQLSRKVNEDGSFRVYFNASKVFKILGSNDTDLASDFVMSSFGSLIINGVEAQDDAFPAYFIDENGHVHMRTDLFNMFLLKMCNFSDIVEEAEYRYEEEISDL